MSALVGVAGVSMKRPRSGDPILHVADVSKAFGGVAANHDVTILIEEGAIAGLIGPNGSGKTTLFNSIVGHHKIDRGSVHFDGHAITGMREPEIARLGVVRTFQQPRVFQGMTCIENMQVSRRWAGEGRLDLFRTGSPEIRKEALRLLDFMGLSDKRLQVAGTMSFGQQKLLELSMALMSGAKMLLLDEPTAGINPALIESVIERLRDVNRAMKTTLLLIEHNMHVVMRLADYVYCLAEGRILAQGPPEHVRRRPEVIQAYLGAK
jgi:neutral amino acid transport system ATP-binding protein